MMTGTGSPASGVALSVIRRKRREAVPAPRRGAVQAPAAAKPADLRFAELGSFLAAGVRRSLRSRWDCRAADPAG
ncbi:hypothetical protein GCM10010300_02600 [Streptomyces olivaceoviridis]|nr:hypothetical protein GCM10010300_02600 [Streptomyces olivaceoviridis]